MIKLKILSVASSPVIPIPEFDADDAVRMSVR